MASQKILIADKDRDLVQALVLRCRELDAEVVVAYDAMTASTLIHRERPDLVCLDANMLVAGTDLSNATVIILTAFSDEETIRFCDRLSAYYVQKGRGVWQQIVSILDEQLNVGRHECDTPEGHGRIEPGYPAPGLLRPSFDHSRNILRQLT